MSTWRPSWFVENKIAIRWIVLALVFFGIVISYIDRGNLGVAAPSIMADFRIAPATMGVLLSAFFWTYAAFQIPAGVLVDRFGIRRAYACAFLVWSLASASIALSRGAGDIIGMRLLLGLAESIGPLASISFIRKNFSGKEQGLPTSIYIAGQNIGPAVGALVGAILIDQFGWRMMFAITGLGALIWLPFWWFAVPADGAPAVPPTQEASAPRAAPGHWTWRMLLAHRALWAMCLSIFFSSYCFYFVLTWMPSYMVLSRGYSTVGMGRVVSTALFTMAVVNVLAGSAADKLAARIGVFRARLWFGVMGYVGTAAMLLLVVIPDRAWTLPIFTFSMCGLGIGNSNYWTISQHVPAKSLVGRTIGVLNTISQLGGIAAPVITGLILGPQRHFGPAILVAGACPLLAAGALLVAGPQGLQAAKTLLAEEVEPD
jgi:MFS family permease